MKPKYVATFLVLFSPNVYSDDAFKMCKDLILASEPYGENASVRKPNNIRKDENEIIFDWPGMGKLVITDKNGQMRFHRVVVSAIRGNRKLHS